MGFSSFKPQEVRQLSSTARRVVRHPGLDILIAPRRLETARILVVTPRRTGNAPARNKVRRQLKAIFYESGAVIGGFDCIVFIKEPGMLLGYDELKKLLLSALAHR
jgi:ribonuclease P protein component